jgi:hypothetical protein
MKPIQYLTASFFLFLIMSESCAQNNPRTLEANDAYVAAPAVVSNQANRQGYELIRKSMKGERFTFPKEWRLVNVILEKSNLNKESEYVLFFQDDKGDVHSIGLDMSGALSGANMIHIQAK